MIEKRGKMTEYWQNLRKKVGHDPIIIPSTAGAIIRDNRILLGYICIKKQYD